MRPIYIILLFISSFSAAFGQSRTIDSLKNLLLQSRQDTSKVLLLAELAGNYVFFKSDTALVLASQAIELARKVGFAKGEMKALTRMGGVLRLRGEFPQALQVQFKALQLSRETGDSEGEAECLLFAGTIYIDLGEYRQALDYLFDAKKIYERLPQPMRAFGLSNIGYAYEKMNKLDSALDYGESSTLVRNVPSKEIRTDNQRVIRWGKEICPFLYGMLA